MSTSWSDREEDIIIENFLKTRKEIVRLLEDNGFARSVEAVKKKKARLRNSGELPAYEEIYSRVEEEASASVFEGVAKRHLYKEYADMLRSIKDDVEKHTTSYKIVPVSEDNESIVMMLSDMHIGKVVHDPTGKEAYNTKIALEYIKSLTAKMLNVISHVQKGTTVDEIVIMLLGDIVDNESIYATQPHHIDSFVAEQVKNATRALWEFIREISDVEGIKRVRVVAVRGNHGRTTYGAEDSNWDNVIYDQLEFISYIHGDTRITVDTQYAEFNVVEVRGHRILMRHEAPVTADTPSAKAKLGGWFDIHKADALCIGHWHHWGVNTWNDRPIFRNGSLPGSDDLAERIAANNKPAQLLFGVNSVRVPTFMYPITFE